MKKIIFICALSASFIFGTTACTDEEIAAGAIGVAIGIGLGNNNDHHRGRHDRHDRYDRYDRYDRNGRNDNYCRDRRNCRYNSTKVVSNNFAENFTVSTFASRHRISDKAAAKIKVAFDKVETEGIGSLQRVGLTKSDLKSVMNHKLPAQSSIKAMSDKLDLSEAQARDLVLSITQEFDAQAKNINSDYWQYCVSKGKWKTQRNSYCKSASWPGCSPQTGAKLCY